MASILGGCIALYDTSLTLYPPEDIVDGWSGEEDLIEAMGYIVFVYAR